MACGSRDWDPETLWDAMNKIDNQPPSGGDDSVKKPIIRLPSRTRFALSIGDTLVYIEFPSTDLAFDTEGGHRLRTKTYYVHSQNLLSTGSAVFKKLLSPKAQERAKKIGGYNSANPLPEGIKYVLNLTPPDDGDEAVDLISALCCPLGIRYWYLTVTDKSASTITLVSGHDEYTRVVYQGKDKPVKVTGNTIVDVLDYCHIRHRFGIEALLRLIEGFSPVLDSAPKAWTLAVLGKYFDCENVVIESTEKWILTGPNNKVLTHAPGTCYRIGHYVNSKLIVDPAYAILVSESAFLAAGRKSPDSRLCQDMATILRRPKEDIDEDDLKSIEAVASDFQARVHGIAKALTRTTMDWLETQDFPEFQALRALENDTSRSSGGTILSQAVHELIDLLRQYVRGRIMSIDLLPSLAGGKRADLDYSDYYTSDQNPKDIYDNLTCREQRYQTRLYWEILRDMTWAPKKTGSNFDFDLLTDRLTRKNNEKTLLSRGAVKVEVQAICDAQKKIEDLILSYLAGTPSSYGDLPKGYNPYETASTEEDHKFSAEETTSSSLNKAESSANQQDDNQSHVSTPMFGLGKFTPSLPLVNYLRRLNKIGAPLFCFVKFQKDLSRYFSSKICRVMLMDPYFDGRIYVNTLLCMKSGELKFLPRWDGGSDDGTGGVFENAVTPAESGVSSSGPGPAEVGTLNTSVAVDNGLSGHVDRQGGDSTSASSFVNVQSNEGKGKGKEVDRDSTQGHGGNHEAMEVGRDGTQDHGGNHEATEVDSDGAHDDDDGDNFDWADLGTGSDEDDFELYTEGGDDDLYD